MTAVQDVKSRADIVEVVSEHVTLQKAGRNYKANCPFHAERTPSFIVFPERQTWRCFGACATGGDVITFVMKSENQDFGQALAGTGAAHRGTAPVARGQKPPRCAVSAER